MIVTESTISVNPASNTTNTEPQIFKAWCPVSKDIYGNFVGILSDTSLDRDNEFMSKELMHSWAKHRNIKALVNHKNEMEKWVGGWTDLEVIEKNGHTALVGKPWFFSKDANPLADSVKKQVEEAIAKGESPGISISAIPLKKGKKKVEEKEYTVYEDAELLEATWTPIQANRNATFGHLKDYSFGFVAKQFDIEVKSFEESKIDKPKEVESCVKHLMNDPDFKPKGGKTKEESAYAVCQSQVGDKKFYEYLDTEEKMENKDIQKESQELELVKKELEDLKKKAVLKATVETEKKMEKQFEPTVENMLKEYYFGRRQ